MDDLKCINIRELALLTGLGYQSIRQAVSDKTTSRKLKLPTITRLGGSVRFRMDHVRAWLNERAGIDSASGEVTKSLFEMPSVRRKAGRPRKVAALRDAA